jgi:hypothetical protein
MPAKGRGAAGESAMTSMHSAGEKRFHCHAYPIVAYYVQTESGQAQLHPSSWSSWPNRNERVPRSAARRMHTLRAAQLALNLVGLYRENTAPASPLHPLFWNQRCAMETAFLTPAPPHATAEIRAAAAARGQATAPHAAAPPSSARAHAAPRCTHAALIERPNIVALERTGLAHAGSAARDHRNSRSSCGL